MYFESGFELLVMLPTSFPVGNFGEGYGIIACNNRDLRRLRLYRYLQRIDYTYIASGSAKGDLNAESVPAGIRG